MAYMYSTEMETFAGLQQVVGALERFNQDRFMSAISLRRMRPADITRLAHQIEAARLTLLDEYENLIDFARTFNSQFATDNNQYFDSAYRLLKQIKTGTRQVKGLFKQFTISPSPSQQRRLPPSVVRSARPSVYERSMLSTDTYAVPMFPIEEMPAEVQNLYLTMQSFFETLSQSLHVCLDTMREETRVRQNPERCCELYNDFKREYCSRIKAILKSIDINAAIYQPDQSEVVALRENSQSEEQFSQQAFHQYSKSQVSVLATKELVEEANRGEFTRTELLLWPKNELMIRKVRHILGRLDSFLAEEYLTYKKIPAIYIAALRDWSCPAEDKLFTSYVRQTYHGERELPKNAAINQQKNHGVNLEHEHHRLINVWNNTRFE